MAMLKSRRPPPAIVLLLLPLAVVLHNTLIPITHISINSILSADNGTFPPAAQTFSSANTLPPGNMAPPLRSSAKPQCFVYDRPPRTGSSTISRALRRCLWNKKNTYVEPALGPREMRAYHMQDMLQLQHPRIGLYGRHISLNARDVRGIRETCGTFFFVTSCKPMRERMWSAAKFKFRQRAAMNKNSHLERDDVQKAMLSLRKDGFSEAYLEAYPYLNPNDEALDMNEDDRLMPDYVVRAEYMEKDLSNLMKALGCSQRFDSINQHFADGDDEVVQEIELKFGDATYQRLMKVAERVNGEGLRRAAQFA